MPGTSPSVLIIRLDAIGDALALTPLLAAFSERAIPVDVVLRDANAGIFSSRAARRILAAGFELRSSTRANRAAIDAFGRELARAQYTHVLVATEDPGGYRLARATRAPSRIGFTNALGKPLKTLWTATMLTQTIFRPAGLDAAAPQECEVLFALGAELLGDAEPSRDIRMLRPLVIERELQPDPRVALQVTDKWERLGIALEDVTALLDRLRQREPVRAIAARTEEAYAQRVARTSNVEIEFFDELEPWKDAIAAARAIVAPDSGAVHVAGMVGTPVVAVFPPSREFERQTGRWRPWAAPYRIVAADAGWPLQAADALGELLP